MAKLTVKLVEEKLHEYSGNFAAVARAFGVSRTAVAHYIRRHPTLHAVAKEAREVMKDNAESALYKAVLGGEGWAVCFFLKTQAKDRGYIERAERDLRGEVRQRVIEEVVEEIVDAPSRNGQADEARHRDPNTE